MWCLGFVPKSQRALCSVIRMDYFKCRNVISISVCGTMSHNDFQMFLLWSQVIVLTGVVSEQSQRAPIFPFLSYLHIPCCMFLYCYLWTMLEHLNKSLPNGEKRRIWIREHNISPCSYSSLVQMTSNSKSFSDPIMCLALRSGPNYRLFPPSQIPDVPLLFLLAYVHSSCLNVLLCAHRGPAQLQCSFHFPKTNLDPRLSQSATPLRAQSFNACPWKSYERVLSVVNNKQNCYIPTAYTQVDVMVIWGGFAVVTLPLRFLHTHLEPYCGHSEVCPLTLQSCGTHKFEGELIGQTWLLNDSTCGW